jgi:hypothetical protein
MEKTLKPWRDTRSNFQIYLDNMYNRYISEKKNYNEDDILSKYEYNKQYNDWLRVKYQRDR